MEERQILGSRSRGRGVHVYKMLPCLVFRPRRVWEGWRMELSVRSQLPPLLTSSSAPPVIVLVHQYTSTLVLHPWRDNEHLALPAAHYICAAPPRSGAIQPLRSREAHNKTHLPTLSSTSWSTILSCSVFLLPKKRKRKELTLGWTFAPCWRIILETLLCNIF